MPVLFSCKLGSSTARDTNKFSESPVTEAYHSGDSCQGYEQGSHHNLCALTPLFADLHVTLAVSKYAMQWVHGKQGAVTHDLLQT